MEREVNDSTPARNPLGLPPGELQNRVTLRNNNIKNYTVPMSTLQEVLDRDYEEKKQREQKGPRNRGDSTPARNPPGILNRLYDERDYTTPPNLQREQYRNVSNELLGLSPGPDTPRSLINPNYVKNDGGLLLRPTQRPPAPKQDVKPLRGIQPILADSPIIGEGSNRETPNRSNIYPNITLENDLFDRNSAKPSRSIQPFEVESMNRGGKGFKMIGERKTVAEGQGFLGENFIHHPRSRGFQPRGPEGGSGREGQVTKAQAAAAKGIADAAKKAEAAKAKGIAANKPPKAAAKKPAGPKSVLGGIVQTFLNALKGNTNPNEAAKAEIRKQFNRL
jgi:hypothetical protein